MFENTEWKEKTVIVNTIKKYKIKLSRYVPFAINIGHCPFRTLHTLRLAHRRLTIADKIPYVFEINISDFFVLFAEFQQDPILNFESVENLENKTKQ